MLKSKAAPVTEVDGKLIRLGESHGVDRQEDHETDPEQRHEHKLRHQGQRKQVENVQTVRDSSQVH